MGLCQRGSGRGDLLRLFEPCREESESHAVSSVEGWLWNSEDVVTCPLFPVVALLVVPAAIHGEGVISIT